MRVAGIIAEYDPFHKGHAAHIQATRQEGKATHVVAVISGSFTQRGMPAAFTKFQRTAMALAGGADLVLELPLPWSMASAQRFAEGGVALLKGLGCVDTLSFGSECGQTAPLQRLAALSETQTFKDALQSALDTGIPYAAAQQAAAASILGEEEAALLNSPNNTLGLEYIRAAASQKADFDYFTLTRQGALHNEDAPKSGFASGSWLRSVLQSGEWSAVQPYVPTAVFSLLQEEIASGNAPVDSHFLEKMLPARLRTMTVAQLAELPYLSEGLEQRLHKAIHTATDYSQLIDAIKTKRYPLSRIRRVLWAAFLGMKKQDVVEQPPYIRLLGMNKRGRDILAAAAPTLPLVARRVDIDRLDARAQRVFELESLATDLTALALPHPQPCGRDSTYKLLSV
ncbi:MAG: nucleotidyltransferase family protein [Clostridia bacterium]|nr:nucleotidyltransferase family protein [Clostridia bacterium]